MKSVRADGKNYFDDGCMPITVRYIDESYKPHHHLDFTDIKHTHAFSEIVIITKGHGVQWLEGYDYPVSAGDVFFLQGNQEHYFKERHGLEIYNVMFDPNAIPLPFERLRTLPGYQVFFLLEPNYRRKHNFKSRLRLAPSKLGNLISQVKKMLEECEQKFAGYDIRLLSLLLEIMIFLTRQYSGSQTVELKSLYRLGKVIGKLENSYNQNWTLPEIAKLANMSKSNLTALFKEATGFSPIDYVIRLRIKQSIQLLQSSNLSISEIAFETGFTDSNYFSRQFKKITSKSPRDYRKQH